jgi:branched-chain amino acid transport system permease protein
LKRYELPPRENFLLGALAFCLLASLFGGPDQWLWLFNFYNIGINIIMAVSLNLINGYTGQFSLGHAGFMAVGAYTAAVITNQFGELNAFGRQRRFRRALLAGGLGAAVPACWSAFPRCGCAAIIWPSSRSASAKSSA